MVVGLLFAAFLVLLGLGAGSRHSSRSRRCALSPTSPTRIAATSAGRPGGACWRPALLVVIGAMIAFYYVSGMDARMDAIGDKRAEGEARPRRTRSSPGWSACTGSR